MLSFKILGVFLLGVLTWFLLVKLPPRKLKSTIQLCMEHCCHVWAGTRSCYLDILEKLQKQAVRVVSLSFSAFRKLLADSRNVSSHASFYRYYFGRCSSELTELIPFPYSSGSSTHYSNRLYDFSVTIIFSRTIRL